MIKVMVGDLVNYSYKVRSKSHRGWGRVVGRGKYHGMGKVLHVLPYEQVGAMAICLKDKEITARCATNDWPKKKAKENKKMMLIIMRGLPGSGKSTKAKSLATGGEIFSTDNFFMKGGKYVYDPSLIGKAHEWNQQAAIAAMIQGISPVVIDNTNVKRMHVEPYIKAAKQLGYEIQVAEPDSPWWKKYFKRDMTAEDKAKLVKELMAHGTHDVPEAAITKMIDGWEHDFQV